jgi:hypothetical protein
MDLEEQIEHEEPRRGRAKKFLIWFFGFILLTGLVAGIVWLVSLERAATAPLRTSDTFINHLLDKDAKAAYALTNDDFKAQTSEEDLKAVAEAVSKGLKRETLKVSSGAIEDVERGKFASVYYEVDGTDAKYKLTVNLLKEKDKGWLVVSADNETR